MPGPEMVRRNFRQYDRDLKQAGMYAVPPGAGHTTYTTTANTGRIIRFVPSRPMTVSKVGIAVNTLSTNDDACSVAIYSSSLVRLATSGAVSGKLNVSAVAKTVDLSAPVTLSAGTIYYVGFSSAFAGGTAAVLAGISYSLAAASQIFGTTAGLAEMATMATAQPLPDPFVITAAGSGPLLAVME